MALTVPVRGVTGRGSLRRFVNQSALEIFLTEIIHAPHIEIEMAIVTPLVPVAQLERWGGGYS